MPENITVEVAYALPKQQVIMPVLVPVNCTVAEAVKLSKIIEKFPEIDLASNPVGIFGKAVKLEATLRAMDRVEIYRPLIADPKAVRKERADAGKQMKKGGGDLPTP